MTEHILFKTIFLSFIILLFLYAASAPALGKTVFPNSSTLQPMPVNVHPNISGNVNYRASQSQLEYNSKQDLSIQVKDSLKGNEIASKNISHDKNLIWMEVFLVAAIFITAVLVYKIKISKNANK